MLYFTPEFKTHSAMGDYITDVGAIDIKPKIKF